MVLLRRFASRDSIAGLVCAFAGIVLTIAGSTIRNPGVDQLGPGWLPQILGIGLVVVGLLIAGSSPAPAEAADGEVESPRVLAGGVALLIVYVLAIENVGYFVSTLVYSAVGLRLFGVRDYRQVAIVSVAMGVVLTLVFGKLLGVDLPHGILF